jgi:hypothetical protein
MYFSPACLLLLFGVIGFTVFMIAVTAELRRNNSGVINLEPDDDDEDIVEE